LLDNILARLSEREDVEFKTIGELAEKFKRRLKMRTIANYMVSEFLSTMIFEDIKKI